MQNETNTKRGSVALYITSAIIAPALIVAGSYGVVNSISYLTKFADTMRSRAVTAIVDNELSRRHFELSLKNSEVVPGGSATYQQLAQALYVAQVRREQCDFDIDTIRKMLTEKDPE